MRGQAYSQKKLMIGMAKEPDSQHNLDHAAQPRADRRKHHASSHLDTLTILDYPSIIDWQLGASR